MFTWYLHFCLLLLGICTATNVAAQPKTEKEYVGYWLSSVQSQSGRMHAMLYPSFDTLWQMVLRQDPKEMENLMSHPEKLKQYDPDYNQTIAIDFDSVIAKGRRAGIHWPETILAGYELTKMNLTRDLKGIEKIMPMRMQGYVFVEDMLTRRRYCIAVTDMMQVKSEWCGGRLINVLEAATIDQYIEALALETKKKLHPELFAKEEEQTPEYLMDDEEEDEDNSNTRGIKQDVVQRTYYQGMFDNETPVELYVRGLKGNCPGTVCSWEAIYKYQDHDEFIRLIVARTPDGKWHFTEDPEVGSMELELVDGKFTGTWISLKDKTEYDVMFEEQSAVWGSKLLQMDDVIENELWAQ